jgi:thymidylate synthase
MEAEDDLGKLYGYQWNNFNDSGINQLKNAIKTLKTNPTDRRILVLAWNPQQLNEMALPPCHFCFQLISDGKYVDLLWSQRSADWFLGVAFDLASYAMLLTLICHQVKMIPRFLAGSFGDAHIYVNHLDQVREQLSREPYPLPTVKILNADDPDWTIWDWKYTEFELENYQCHPAIKAPIAIYIKSGQQDSTLFGTRPLLVPLLNAQK